MREGGDRLTTPAGNRRRRGPPRLQMAGITPRLDRGLGQPQPPHRGPGTLAGRMRAGGDSLVAPVNGQCRRGLPPRPLPAGNYLHLDRTRGDRPQPPPCRSGTRGEGMPEGGAVLAAPTNSQPRRGPPPRLQPTVKCLRLGRNRGDPPSQPLQHKRPTEQIRAQPAHQCRRGLPRGATRLRFPRHAAGKDSCPERN